MFLFCGPAKRLLQSALLWSFVARPFRREFRLFFGCRSLALGNGRTKSAERLTDSAPREPSTGTAGDDGLAICLLGQLARALDEGESENNGDGRRASGKGRFDCRVGFKLNLW